MCLIFSTYPLEIDTKEALARNPAPVLKVCKKEQQMAFKAIAD
jgi:hypothetical protein